MFAVSEEEGGPDCYVEFIASSGGGGVDSQGGCVHCLPAVHAVAKTRSW